MMRHRKRGRSAGQVIAVLGLSSCLGCASLSATQLGQTAGTIAGAAIVPGIGGPLGGLIGMLAGLVIDRQVDKVREQKEQIELSEQLQAGVSPPSVIPQPAERGQPTRVWVDEQIERGQITEGRFEVRTVAS